MEVWCFLSPTNPPNNFLQLDHPADKLAGGQLFLLDLLSAVQCFLVEFLQYGPRPSDLFGWCAGLF